MSFGGSAKRTSQKESSRKQVTGEVIQTEQLRLDEAALEKIIGDVLSGPQGLASIFAGEQTAGIFDSSVAAQASGDLVASLIGEIAKLTGVREIKRTEDTLTEAAGKSIGTEFKTEAFLKL